MRCSVKGAPYGVGNDPAEQHAAPIDSRHVDLRAGAASLKRVLGRNLEMLTLGRRDLRHLNAPLSMILGPNLENPVTRAMEPAHEDAAVSRDLLFWIARNPHFSTGKRLQKLNTFGHWHAVDVKDRAQNTGFAANASLILELSELLRLGHEGAVCEDDREVVTGQSVPRYGIGCQFGTIPGAYG